MDSNLTTPVANGVALVGAEMQPLWDAYVEQHKDATHCHRWAWKTVIENAFHHSTYYLAATSQGRLTGVLPLVWQHSRLFGSFLTSMPFLTAGGPLADSVETERRLVDHAIAIAKDVRARYLQLRYRGQYRLELPAAEHKVSTVRSVSRDTEGMWKSLNSNNRRKVNKAAKSGLSAKAEGAQALDDFYELYARNMRDLGTPVYAKRFFSEVLRAFPQHSEIVMVRLGEEPVAAALLLSFRDVLEATWMCSNCKYLSLQPNMMLYWTNLKIAGERGFRLLDFGRSTRDSGTHKFKQLWDTEDVPLYWAQWTAEGKTAGDLNPDNPRFQLAVRLWTKLPLGLSKVLGPYIVKDLP
jgi:FemAB-related protein (PEP-CTERM system-associated)